MFTVLFIVVVFILTSVGSRVILLFNKNKNPQKSVKEVLEKSQEAININAIFWLFILIAGIYYINFEYKTETEKNKIEEEKIAKNKILNAEKEKAAEIKRLGLTKEELSILSQRQMDVTDFPSEVANAYKILKSDFYFVDTEKIRFTGLAKKAKGTAYEKRVEKTRDSLVENEHQIAQRQIKDSDAKATKEGAAERKKYGEDFHNLLLDRGLNIDVKVTGKDNKTIKLKYVLFNDVWFRKFETEGYFDQIHDKGFTVIELTDGYNWGKGKRYND